MTIKELIEILSNYPPDTLIGKFDLNYQSKQFLDRDIEFIELFTDNQFFIVESNVNNAKIALAIV